MTALEIACRHTDPDGTNCAAQAGELCIRTSAYGERYPAQVPHAERILDAAAMSCEAKEPEAVDRAIEAVVDQIL